MKEIFYDWGGANVWLFHAINNIRSEYWDKFMLLGTALGEHDHFPLYLGLTALIALWSVVKIPITDPVRYQTQVKNWLAIITVFSVAYFPGWSIACLLKPLLDFPRPPLALRQKRFMLLVSPNIIIVCRVGIRHLQCWFMPVCGRFLSAGRVLVGALLVLWVGISRVSLARTSRLM